MAIDNISPAANQTVVATTPIVFIVDDTYTTLLIKYQSSTALESVYNSGAGGAQSGYTVAVTNSGGRDTFTFTRDAGWETDPLQLTVTEDETGTTATTTWTYDLFPTTSYPEGMNPYNSQGEGVLIVQNGGSVVLGSVSILNAGTGITATADGEGKVTLTGVGGSGSGDVIGPAGGTVDGELAVFDDTTGKLLRKPGSGATEAAIAANTAKTSNVEHTGDVAGATVLLIADDKVITRTILNSNVTLEKLEDIPTANVLGRVTGGTGAVEDLTATQLTTIPNVFTSSLKGLVPASGGTSTQYLSADGSFSAPAGTGGNVNAAVNFTVDNEIIRANGAAAKDVQGSAITISDSGVLAVPNDINVTGGGNINTFTTGYVNSAAALIAGTVVHSAQGIRIGETSGPFVAGSDPGFGQFYVKDDAPSRGKFVDDTGKEMFLNASLSGAGTPGVTTGDGLPLGTVYADITNDLGYILVDNTTGINVWDGGPSGGGSGDVTATASLTDNRLMRGDTPTKGIQNSGISVDDSDNLTGIGSISLSGTVDGIDIATDVAANTTHKDADGTSHARVAENTELAAGWDGSVLDTPAVVISSSGSQWTATLEKNGTGDVRYRFGGETYTLDCTPAASVNLTAGTATVPQLNYVYVVESGGTLTLTASTSGFPDTAARVATCILQDATNGATDGPFKEHLWTDHITNGGGHITHITEKLRASPASWLSGVAATMAVSAPDAYFATSVGAVYQLHDHVFPARDMATTSAAWVVNDPTTAYKRITTLDDVTQDGAGGTINNKHFSLVLWGSINETEANCKLFINLPAGTYNSAANAARDAEGYTNSSIPSDFTGTGFLIARFNVIGATSGTWVESSVVDLRGLTPSGSPAGSGGITDHGDLAGLTDDDHTQYGLADASRSITHTGDVTSTGSSAALTIAAEAVTLAKQADLAQSTIQGRAAAAGTGVPTALTPTQVRTIINVEDNSVAAGTSGDAHVTADGSSHSDVVANTAKVTNATHTGDVEGATALTIADEAVTLAKLAHIATTTVVGRVAVGTGDPSALTATQLTTIPNIATTALKGLAPATVDTDSTKYLSADGTYTAPSGTGFSDAPNAALFTERPDHVNIPAAGFGEVWVKNESPNVAIFTDDGGVDHQLNVPAVTITGETYGSISATTQTLTLDAIDLASEVSGLLPGTNIADEAVTLAKLAHIAQDTFIGKPTGSGTGDPVALTKTQALAVLNVADGATDDTAADAAQSTANAALPKLGGEMSGNITMAAAETVDGRDLSVDGTKLDLISVTSAIDLDTLHGGQLAGYTLNATDTVPMADPTAGGVALNDADPKLVTQIAIADDNANGNDYSSLITQLVPGHYILINDVGTAGSNLYLIDDLITDNTGWTQIPVSHQGTPTVSIAVASKLEIYLVSFATIGNIGQGTLSELSTAVADTTFGGTAVGDIPRYDDLGSSVPGYPAIDGSQITNLAGGGQPTGLGVWESGTAATPLTGDFGPFTGSLTTASGITVFSFHDEDDNGDTLDPELLRLGTGNILRLEAADGEYHQYRIIGGTIHISATNKIPVEHINSSATAITDNKLFFVNVSLPAASGILTFSSSYLVTLGAFFTLQTYNQTGGWGNPAMDFDAATSTIAGVDYRWMAPTMPKDGSVLSVTFSGRSIGGTSNNDMRLEVMRQRPTTASTTVTNALLGSKTWANIAANLYQRYEFVPGSVSGSLTTTDFQAFDRIGVGIGNFDAVATPATSFELDVTIVVGIL